MTHSLPVNRMVPGRQPSGEAGRPAGQRISLVSARLSLVRSHPSSPREPARPQRLQSQVATPQTA